MNSGGTNGTVKSVTTTAGGTTVVVSFPALVGPPPIPAHDDVYEPCIEPWLSEFKRVQNALGALKVDVVPGPGGSVVSTAVHA